MGKARRQGEKTLALDLKAFLEGESIQGRIREDGGDIRFEGLEGSTVRVCMTAACADCPSGPRTVRHFLEPAMRARFGDDLAIEARFVKPYFKP